METIRNNKAAETILEFNKIKEIWKGYAMTDGAKEAIEGAAPMLSESQVLARLRETTEARDKIQRSGQPPLVSLSGIREWMRLAEIGGCLTAEQLEGMERALAAVDRMLQAAVPRLNPGGRLAVITFHSLEDRIVKTIFRKNENPCTCPSDFPVCVCGKKSKGKVITRKPILPSKTEMETNPRSKSAKLRIFERRVTE